jgi:hypothetical protein
VGLRPACPVTSEPASDARRPGKRAARPGGWGLPSRREPSRPVRVEPVGTAGGRSRAGTAARSDERSGAGGSGPGGLAGRGRAGRGRDRPDGRSRVRLPSPARRVSLRGQDPPDCPAVRVIERCPRAGARSPRPPRPSGRPLIGRGVAPRSTADRPGIGAVGRRAGAMVGASAIGWRSRPQMRDDAERSIRCQTRGFAARLRMGRL